MMRAFRLAGVALAAALTFAFVTAAPASADEAKSVQLASQDGRNLNFLVYLDPNAPGVENGATVDASVIVAGVEIPSEASKIVEDTDPKQSVLVLDTSASMRGPRLAAAKEAAINYVLGMPGDVAIGLVSFSTKPTIEVKPTTDKQAVIDAIGKLNAVGKTALYDGIIAGLDLANPEKGARVVVLSDGADSASAATVADVTSRAKAEAIPIDVVALNPNVEHAAILRSIAVPSGGQFILATGVNGLNDAFDQATGSFGGKVAITSTLPDDVDGSGRFAIVTITAGDSEFKGTTQLPSDPVLAATQTSGVVSVPVDTGTQAPAPTSTASAGSGWTWLYAILAALIVGVAALAIASYRRQQKSRLRTEQVLWYSSAVQTGTVGARPDIKQDGMLDGIDEWMSTKSWYPGIDNKLDNAGLTLTVATWLLIRIGAALVLALLLGLIIGNALIGVIVGGLVGWLVTGMWLNSRQDARRKDFNDELADFLLLMASSLRSGLSFQQGLDSSAAEGTGEVSRQMRRALREVQMGSTIEAALMRVADRMESEDMRWVVAALAIQREVGGNLSNVLDTAAETIKGRAELRREVRTLSAEGKLSGWVLAALPIGLFFYMVFANREYVSFFWTNVIGYFLLGFLLILFIVGVVWMRRLVRIEV